MAEAFICQVKMFFKKTIIKNHDFFCLSSCDVVTFVVRIATFRIFECIKSLKKNPVFTVENECYKTPESRIQNSYNIKNLLDWGKISIAALEGELNKIC